MWVSFPTKRNPSSKASYKDFVLQDWEKLSKETSLKPQQLVLEVQH